jgi:hypothetical protein
MHLLEQFPCAVVGLFDSPALAHEPIEVKLTEWALGIKELSVESGEIRF